MQVSHGDDNEGVFIQAEDQSIREARQKAAAKSRLYLRARHRKAQAAPKGPIEFVEELASKPFSLLVVPDDSVVKLLPGEGKKPGLQARRCLAMTVS